METGPENANGIIACPSCGAGNEKEARFCVYCGIPFIKRRGVPSRKRYLLYGMISLVLVGVGGVGLCPDGKWGIRTGWKSERPRDTPQ